jgi:hypothetical protein
VVRGCGCGRGRGGDRGLWVVVVVVRWTRRGRAINGREGEDRMARLNEGERNKSKDLYYRNRRREED